LNNGGVITIPGRAVQAVDTTGAGDCFIGALAAQLAAGTTIRACKRCGIAVCPSEANSTDEKLARTYAGTICKPSAVKAFLEFARQQAREILQAYWGAVLDLAEALDRRGTLCPARSSPRPSVRPSKPRKWPAVSTCSKPPDAPRSFANSGAWTL
jgi:hypothetical protein